MSPVPVTQFPFESARSRFGIATSIDIDLYGTTLARSQQLFKLVWVGQSKWNSCFATTPKIGKRI